MRYAKVGEPPKPSRITPGGVLACGIVAIVVAVILYPVFERPRNGSWRSRSLHNLKKLARGLSTYAEDHDDKLPTASLWMDALWPYEHSTQIYVNPYLAKVEDAPSFENRRSGRYGFTFLSGVDQKALSAIERPHKQVVIFSGSSLLWNSRGPFDTEVEHLRPDRRMTITADLEVRPLRADGSKTLGPEGRMRTQGAANK